MTLHPLNLRMIYQASLNQGTLLNIWKPATVVPVFKKGSRSNLAHLAYLHLCQNTRAYCIFTQEYLKIKNLKR